MTINFVKYRKQVASKETRAFISNVLYSLADPSSFYTNLQLIYNNPEHFQTGLFGVCTYHLLTEIAQEAYSNQGIIQIEGNIHENFHVSGILLNSTRGNKLPVYDSYIRIKFRGVLYHILVNPPRLTRPEPYTISPSRYSHQPMYFIPPSI